jgi:hypothetical protein
VNVLVEHAAAVDLAEGTGKLARQLEQVDRRHGPACDQRAKRNTPVALWRDDPAPLRQQACDAFDPRQPGKHAPFVLEALHRRAVG